jgi:hypothetical protein
MSAQLNVGPHSSASLIRSNSEFETGKITFNGGADNIAINISSTAANSIVSAGGAILNTLQVGSGFSIDSSGNVITNDLSVSGTAFIPIGLPTYTVNQEYPELGETTYSTNIGLGLTSTLFIPDALSKIDDWLKTYLIDKPPSVSVGATSVDNEKITLNWTNPQQLESGFSNIELPHITEIKIDYVQTSLNPSNDFSHPSTVTISTGSKSTTKLEAYILGVTNTDTGFLDGTTWKEFFIESNISYDFRVYADNFNDTNTPNYQFFSNLATTPVGPPEQITNPTLTSTQETQLGISWVKPSDHDTTTIGTQNVPFINTYGVTFLATETPRFGGVISDSGITFTVGTTLTNTNDFITVQGLNPGTTYSFDIAAKNTINSLFGNTVSITLGTSFPTAPPNLSVTSITDILNINNLSSPYGVSGVYSLDGLTLHEHIVNYNNIDGTLNSFELRTDLTNVLINNYSPGTTSANTGTITAYGGLKSAPSSTSTNTIGFGGVSINGTYPDTDVTLGVTNDTDFYISSGITQQGFWKSFQMYAIGTTSNFTPSDSEYTMFVEHNPVGGPLTTTNAVDFVVDNLNVNPGISGLGISGVASGSTITYVSGVPLVDPSTDFAFRFNVNNLGNFLPNDKKHADYYLKSSNGDFISNVLSITQGDIGITHRYYNAGNNPYEISTTFHNTTGLVLGVSSVGNPRETIQFQDYTVNLNTTGSTLFDENITLGVTTYSIYGSSTLEQSGFVSNTGITQPLRIDTLSITNDLADASISGTYGRRVKSGITEFPATVNVDFGGDYLNTSNLAIGADYVEELQFVNGKYQGPASSEAFLDYSQYYIPSTSITGPDYSGVTTVGYRYATFKFQRGFTGFKNKIKITIDSPIGISTNFSQLDGANHRLYLKVNDTRSLAPGAYTYDTPWLDCTDSIDFLGLFNVANGSGCLDTLTSSDSIRNCLIKNTGSDAEFFVKIGWQNTDNFSFNRINLEVVDSF